MEVALIGVGGTLLGTVLGSFLTWLLSKDATAKERQHQEAELIRQRREAAAVALGSDLERLDDALPEPAAPSGQSLPQLQEAAGLLPRCEKRAALIEDASITDRLHALNYALWTAADEAEEKAEQGKGSVNIWSLRIAIADLYAAVDAYQLRKNAPAPVFLSADEQIELTGGEPGGMQKINQAVRLRQSAARKARRSE